MKKDVFIFDVLKLYSGLGSKIYVFLRFILLPFNKIERYIPKKGKIIDVGCGYGSLDAYLALKEPKRKIIGMDLNEKRIVIANKATSKISNAEFFAKDFTKDVSIKKANCMILVDLLHHIPYETQKKLLRECYKKLEVGGLLIIKDVGDKPKWKYYYNYLQDKIVSKQRKLFFIKPQELQNLLVKLNFNIKLKSQLVKTWPFNPIPHFIIVATN